MAPTDDTVRGDIELGAPGGFFAKARNVDMRTALIFLAMLSALGAVGVGVHHEVNAQTHSKDLAQTLDKSQKVIADALKEVTTAQKERDNALIQVVKELSAEQKKMTIQVTIGNCMNEQAMKGRSDAREACRRIIRDNQ